MGDRSKEDKKYTIDYRYNLKTYWGFVLRHKALLFWSILFVVITEGLGSLDRFLFKAIIDRSTAYTANEISRSLFSAFLVNLALIYLAIIIGRVVFRWLRVHALNRFHTTLEFDLKQRYFNHLINLSHNFHTTHKIGSFISRINRGANAMDRMTEFMSTNIVPLIIQFAIVIITASYFDTNTVYAICGMAVAFVAWGLYLQKLQRPATIEINRAEDFEKGQMADFFTNVESIKHFGKESYIGNRYRKLGENTAQADIKRADYQRWLRAGHGLIIAIGTFFIFYFPLQRFVNGELTVGTLALIYALYGGLLPYLGQFVDGMRGYYRSMEDFNDLFEYGKINNEIKDAEDAKVARIIDGSIEFRDVSFSYRGERLFNKFSLSIPKNKRVAFVGLSGSGKTTLVKLLYRLYDLNSGEIIIDDKNIKEFSQQSLRSELSIVPQECVLFDDSIYNNILFSRPDATRAEVMKAIRFAQLDGFVKRLPEKEDTVVGERGVKLSGGEKQRVSIARALLANKKILVLDEATSSLDSQTEHEIQKDLQKLMQGRTSIIIAHRLSTIMHADIIVVLDKGKIVQQGKHNELINKPGMYRKLWDLQKGGYLADDKDD